MGALEERPAVALTALGVTVVALTAFGLAAVAFVLAAAVALEGTGLACARSRL